MAERRQVPTMSVKLAIQRELEYRKIASMLSDVEEDLLPLEGPPSRSSAASYNNDRDHLELMSFITANNQSLIPTPVLSNQELSLFPTPAPERGLVSGPSVVPLDQVACSAPNSFPLQPIQVPRTTTSISSRPRLVPAPTMNSSVKRKAEASSLEYYPPQQQVPSQNRNTMSRNYFCKVCQVSCSGYLCYIQHLNGQKHKANQRSGQCSRSGGYGTDKPKCNICQIWCTDQNSLSLHLNGQKHRAKLQDLQSGSRNVERDYTKQFWCELCQVPCTNEDTFLLHLKGKSHAARASAANTR